MEQALVLVSIVLGVAIAFELEHLNKVLRAKNVKWHWAQPLFALFVLLTIIALWWGAANQPEGSLTFGEFLPIMFQLCVLALLAGVSFPDSVPEEGLDMAQYYQDNRRYQWILMNLYTWTVHIGYTVRSARTSEDLTEFIMMVGPDTFGVLVITAMIFARRWWQVALGFAILSLAPAVWVFRTLG
jgi:hypothetical protein